MSENYFRFFDLPEELRRIIIKNMTVLSRINFIIAINGSLNIKASKKDWDDANSNVSSDCISDDMDYDMDYDSESDSENDSESEN
jgi:hypothetical protein